MKKLSDSMLFILGGVAGSCITLMIKGYCDTKRENIQNDLDDLYQLSAEIKGNIVNNYEYRTEDNTKNLIKMMDHMDELYAKLKSQNNCNEEFLNKAEEVINHIHSAARDLNVKTESSSKGIMEPDDDDEDEALFSPLSLMKKYKISANDLIDSFEKIGEKDTASSIYAITKANIPNFNVGIITEKEYDKIVEYLDKQTVESFTPSNEIKDNESFLLSPMEVMNLLSINLDKMIFILKEIGENDTAKMLEDIKSSEIPNKGLSKTVMNGAEYHKIHQFLCKRKNNKHILIKQDMLLSELANELDVDPSLLKKNHQIQMLNIESICAFNKQDLSDTYNADFSVEPVEDYVKRIGLAEEKVDGIEFLENDLPSFSVFNDIDNASGVDAYYTVMGH